MGKRSRTLPEIGHLSQVNTYLIFFIPSPFLKKGIIISFLNSGLKLTSTLEQGPPANPLQGLMGSWQLFLWPNDSSTSNNYNFSSLYKKD